MTELKDGMILYHGSYTKVSNIDISKCVPFKDFGRGFYVTASREQAENFVRLSLNRAAIRGIPLEKADTGYVSLYKLELSDKLIQKAFDETDVEWLHFVVSNRDNTYFTELREYYKKYNVIIGKIANDRTASTLQAYIENVYGPVGTQEADLRAIQTLLPNRLEDQICFRDENAVACLKYVESIEYGTR